MVFPADISTMARIKSVHDDGFFQLTPVLWHWLRVYMMMVSPADISTMARIKSVHDDGFSSWHQYYGID